MIYVLLALIVGLVAVALAVLQLHRRIEDLEVHARSSVAHPSLFQRSMKNQPTVSDIETKL